MALHCRLRRQGALMETIDGVLVCWNDFPFQQVLRIHGISTVAIQQGR